MQETLNIALCDTNFADRKQMERLLERESDKRSSSCVFYMETIGSRDALLENPRVYDAYFLDIPDSEYSAYDLAKEIQAKGIHSPIVFCVSSMDYRTCGELLQNSVFLNKPIQVSALSLVLDEIILQKQEQYIPTIELRNATDVFYLTEEEIQYCENHRNSRRLTIHLANGTTREAEGFINNLCHELSSFGTFFMANPNTIVNARYVNKVNLFHIILQNGKSVRLSSTGVKEVKALMEKLWAAGHTAK